MKKCSKCGEEKILEEFYKSGIKITSRCKKCISENGKEKYKNNPIPMREYKKQQYYNDPSKFRERQLKRDFGIDLLVYNNMFEEQYGVCAICGKVDRDKRLAVDHNHLTKKVRGLLCGDCNRGLGIFKDQIFLLQKAISYLEK